MFWLKQREEREKKLREQYVQGKKLVFHVLSLISFSLYFFFHKKLHQNYPKSYVFKRQRKEQIIWSYDCLNNISHLWEKLGIIKDRVYFISFPVSPKVMEVEFYTFLHRVKHLKQKTVNIKGHLIMSLQSNLIVIKKSIR